MNSVEYIHSLRTFGKKAELKNIEVLLDRLGNPHKDMKFVHIAGTNGKGSVASMINSILIANDKKVGLFTSPFIEYFNERICVNNTPIPDEALDRITNRIKPYIEYLAKKDICCTVFDVICAIGFVYFKEQNCDIVVLEVGLGGRFDATNIIEKPLCSVICAIGYDHMQYLGDTIEKIAFEKCGIIKEDTNVVSYPIQDGEAAGMIERTCQIQMCNLIVPDISRLEVLKCDLSGSDFIYKGKRYNIKLVGEYQIYNSLCAIETAMSLGIENETICVGLKNTKWKCRFEVFEICGKTVIIDGAHNSHGITAFLRSANKFFENKSVCYIFGILNEKDIDRSCAVMASAKGDIIVTSVNSDRCYDAEAVYKKISVLHNQTCFEADNEEAFKMSAESDCQVICILGSLYMAGDMRKIVENFSSIDKTI